MTEGNCISRLFHPIFFRLNLADFKRRRILTQPNTAVLDLITDYLSAFFGLEIRVMDACLARKHSNSVTLSLSKRKVKVLKSKLFALDLIDHLVEEVLPAHPSSLLALAVTAEEIYDSDPDTVIYGRAMGDGGCVLSLSCIGDEEVRDSMHL